MPKKTININDDLDVKIKEYVKKYNMTYTSLLTIALVKYFDSLEMNDKVKKALMEIMKHEQDDSPKIWRRSDTTKSSK